MEIFSELFVRDLGANLEVFRDLLSFEVVREEPEFAELRHGTSRLLLNASLVPGVDPSDARPRGLGFEMGIVVDDLDGCFERVRTSSLRVMAEPAERPWGRRDFRFLLPDGYYLRVTT